MVLVSLFNCSFRKCGIIKFLLKIYDKKECFYILGKSVTTSSKSHKVLLYPIYERENKILQPLGQLLNDNNKQSKCIKCTIIILLGIN